MNKKTKIKILLFTLLSSFLFLNCEKEDDNLNEKKEVQITYENIRRINNLEIQKNKVISSKLNSLNQELNVKRQSRAIYSEEFDFYIETDYATYIENQTNEYHSYTFPIYRSIDTNILENLVFSLNPDGTYRTVIVSYNISAQEKQNLLNGREVNLEGKITYTEINGNELSTDIFGKIDGSSIGNCMGYVSMTWCGCNNPEHQGGMENGAPCPCYRYDREYFGCGNSSGGSDSGAGDTGAGDTGSGTGPSSSESGGSGTGGGSVSTSPTPIDYQKLREKCFAQNNPEVSSWLNQPENADIKNDVIDYLENSVNPDGLQSTESCYPEESVDKVLLLKNLISELDNNPNLLIDIPCSQLPQWIQIAQYNLPQSVLDKVSNLQIQNSTAVPNWDIQTLYGAEGAIVNMDFFPVTISQFPTNPVTDLPYTPEEFYNFFRLNINLFTQASGVNFYPSTITGVNESLIWNSDTPLDAILSINMDPDSGSVICSNYSENNWYFTTLTTPWAFSWSQDDYDGYHPVSGNREFGYYQSTTGNYVFFVRGVDRINRAAVFTIANNTPWWDSPFSGADEKWNAMQENLKNYIETNGGAAVINTDNIYRPNWNDIKDVLNGIKPLSDLGCN